MKATATKGQEMTTTEYQALSRFFTENISAATAGDNAHRIPQAITALLAIRTNENLELTVTPFQVEEANGGWMVTLCACRETGEDVQVRVILTGAHGTRWMRREWANDVDGMTAWKEA